MKKVTKYQCKPCVKFNHISNERRDIVMCSKVPFGPYSAMTEGSRITDPIDVIPDALKLFEDMKEFNGRDWYTYS